VCVFVFVLQVFHSFPCPMCVCVCVCVLMAKELKCMLRKLPITEVQHPYNYTSQWPSYRIHF
jgi:hypothetical protein